MKFGEFLSPGGFMVLVVPAYDWLIDKEHHKAVGAVRRYTKNRLLEILAKHPMQLIRITHLFGSVLPAVAGTVVPAICSPETGLISPGPILNLLILFSTVSCLSW